MSLHADLNPEAKALMLRQKRISTATSIVVSILMIAVIILGLGLFLLPNLIKESPTIVTYQAESADLTEEQPKKVNTQIQRKPSAPSAAFTKVIAGSAPSAISIPVPEVEAVESMDFGSAQDFGNSWGEGIGLGSGGGGASFFNQSVKASRIAYVIDYSQSMRGEKDRLMREELTKSISGLKAGTQY